MTSNPLPWSTSRLEGCTLTGALSVTTEVRDGVTILHGPAGCAQHNASLIHATLLDRDTPHLLRILSSDLDEPGVIFGGEGALAACIREASREDPRVIFVLSTCVVQTIGDDVGAVCGRDWGVPVIPVPGAGFLGGGFQDGMRNALISLGEQARAGGTCGEGGSPDGGITLVGEKNLEADVDENFAEVSRLLALLGVRPGLRFVRGMEWPSLGGLARGRLNILREPELRPVGDRLARRFGTPYLESFPVGLSGSLRFLEEVAGILGTDPSVALEEERGRQEEALARFDDLRGGRIRLSPTPSGMPEPFAAELSASLGLLIADDGVPLPLPSPLPIGTAGLVRLLHRWRRALHA
jgi:nitrogenase molybdenum-iron protein alpha/beta subunit